MFTGIVEEIGTIKSIKASSRSMVLHISARIVLEGLNIGESISVNGVCLTVTSFDSNSFCADIMPETMQKSSLGSLNRGGSVNLERALTLNSRLGGHIVSGHIDGTGKIITKKQDENAIRITIAACPAILRYIIEKGSVAIDGISLTVAAIEKDSFMVSLIPHTKQKTTLCSKGIGELVNIENDQIAKYIEKLTHPTSSQDRESEGLSMEFLIKNGF